MYAGGQRFLETGHGFAARTPQGKSNAVCGAHPLEHAIPRLAGSAPQLSADRASERCEAFARVAGKQ